MKVLGRRSYRPSPAEPYILMANNEMNEYGIDKEYRHLQVAIGCMEEAMKLPGNGNPMLNTRIETARKRLNELLKDYKRPV